MSNIPKGFMKLLSMCSRVPEPDETDEAEAEAGLRLLGVEDLMTPSQTLLQEQSDMEQSGWKKYMKINLTIIAIVFAIMTGALMRLREEPYSKREVMYVGFIGTMYLRMLQCLAAPLLITSVLSSLGKLNIRLAGFIGLRTIVYFLSTTLIAISIGVTLTFVIQPGKDYLGDAGKSTSESHVRETTIEDAVFDLLRNAIPFNLVRALLFVTRTDLIKPELSTDSPDTDAATDVTPSSDELPPKTEWDFVHNENVRGTNFLGLILFTIIFSLSIGYHRREDHKIAELIDNINDVILLVLRAGLWLTPPGVFFLVVSKIIELEDWAVFLGQVGLYSLTVFLGLAIHCCIVLPLIYSAFTRRLPFMYFYNLSEALLTAFATSSSLATLPVTLDCVERKNKIPVIVSRFVVTLGATINMDGTALYEAVAPLFIAQIRKLTVPPLELILMSVTALLASVGAAGIPQSGLVIMVIVFAIIGIDPEDISYIIMVDWLLDRFRTLTNVTSDSVGAAVVYELSRKRIEELRAEIQLQRAK